MKKQRWVDRKTPVPLTGVITNKQGTLISYCPYCERITPFTNHKCNICHRKASILQRT